MNSLVFYHSIIGHYWIIIVAVLLVVDVVVTSPPCTAFSTPTIPLSTTNRCWSSTIIMNQHYHPSSTQQQQLPVAVAIRQRRHNQLGSKKGSTQDDDTTTTTATTTITVERPDPSILLSSQSDTIQKLGIVGITTALSLGTYGVIQLLTLLETSLPDGWYTAWRDYTWPIPFGLIFIAAGIAHFIMKDTFTAMVPPKDTWGGLWQVPAPFIESISKLYQPISYAEYHVYWSGLAEFGGGVLLIVSFLFPNSIPITIPASLIFLLLICVTPANIYMATHDVQAPNLPPIPYPAGHIGRGIFQCILLAMFWKLAFP